MIEDYLNQAASNVALSNHLLFSGPSASTLTLTGTKPSISFRLKINVSGADCAGSMTINSETITFVTATTKVSTTLLTALPTITTSGLNCMILITCIDSGGADIKDETLTTIATRTERYDSGYYDPQGVWTKTDTLILTTTALNIGDIVRRPLRDYTIRKAEDNPDLGGVTEFYSYLAN
jgi:hypothetical protein